MSNKTWFEEEVDRLKDDFDYRLEGYILNFTRQICMLMESKKITRSDLAKRLDVSKAYVTEVLSGKPNLTFESMLKLCDAVGATLENNILDGATSQSASSWRNIASSGIIIGRLNETWTYSGSIPVATAVQGAAFTVSPSNYQSLDKPSKGGEEVYLEENGIESSCLAA